MSYQSGERPVDRRASFDLKKQIKALEDADVTNLQAAKDYSVAQDLLRENTMQSYVDNRTAVCVVRTDETQTVADSTNAVVIWQVHEGGADWRVGPGNTTLAVPEDGLYEITLYFQLGTMTAGARVRGVIDTPGRSYTADFSTAAADSVFGGGTKTVARTMTAGDTIYCTVWQNNGFTETIQNKTTLIVKRLA